MQLGVIQEAPVLHQVCANTPIITLYSTQLLFAQADPGDHFIHFHHLWPGYFS